jgi:hypothetical protein
MKVHNSVTLLRSDGAAARAIDHTVCKGEFHNHVVWRISLLPVRAARAADWPFLHQQGLDTKASFVRAPWR